MWERTGTITLEDGQYAVRASFWKHTHQGKQSRSFGGKFGSLEDAIAWLKEALSKGPDAVPDVPTDERKEALDYLFIAYPQFSTLEEIEDHIREFGALWDD